MERTVLNPQQKHKQDKACCRAEAHGKPGVLLGLPAKQKQRCAADFKQHDHERELQGRHLLLVVHVIGSAS
ncbi:hypothetical protein D3C75_995160 [compost metagenome]